MQPRCDPEREPHSATRIEKRLVADTQFYSSRPGERAGSMGPLTSQVDPFIL